MLKKIKNWYQGEYKAYDNDPDSNIIRHGGKMEKHWTAKVANSLVKFYLEHWKWIWGILIAIIITQIK